MSRTLRNVMLFAGIPILIAVFVVGWILLDRFLSAEVSAGTRTLYQETAREDVMEEPVAFVGAEKCAQCHLTVEQEWLHSSHNAVACENCHGPRSIHIEEGVACPVDTSADFCLTCHAQLASRPESFPQVEGEEHSGGLPCIQCHNPMHPNINTAPEISHSASQDADCLACHNESSLKPIPTDHLSYANDRCLDCHRAKE